MPVITDQETLCYHCGEPCHAQSVKRDDHLFCCTGCLTVYEILKENQLEDYYKLESFPGKPQASNAGEFQFLDHAGLSSKLLRFESDELNKVDLYLPQIHCSSCIWLLEHLDRLHAGILYTKTTFNEKRLTVEYDPKQLDLSELAQLVSDLGYKPNFNLDGEENPLGKIHNRELILQIGVAGFCFGNIMLLSFPEYLGLGTGGEQALTSWISYIQLLLTLPVIFYCAKGYYKSALNSIKQHYLNIDVPITLGITALFLWSLYEVTTAKGPGYLDTLSGLLFLLLIGKWIQEKTYQGFSFDRDYRAYFPLAVTRVKDEKEEPVLVRDLKIKDTILIRNHEVIPADCTLMDSKALIDYSFVSGEDRPVSITEGETIYAGGRHIGVSCRYQVLKPVSQSRLVELWDQPAFRKKCNSNTQYLVNQISHWFTYVIVAIAIIATGYWLWQDPGVSLFVFASVLIVACPCAISMATPYTLDAARRVLGLNQFYLKNSRVLETMAILDRIVFDKTGTLTAQTTKIQYCGKPLSEEQAALIATLAAQSVHPVSREILHYCKTEFNAKGDLPRAHIREITGQGIEGKIAGQKVAIGKAGFVGLSSIGNSNIYTYISVDKTVIGYFVKQRSLRKGVELLFNSLECNYALSVLSGDGPNEWELHQLPEPIPASFNQSPLDKLHEIQQIQQSGAKVAMVGDGLNDAGALKQSDVGIAVTENIHQFTPASDAIISGKQLHRLPLYLKLARWSRHIILGGFMLSFLYNLVGLTLAVTAQLTPLTAAILMPVSSISVVIFSSLSVQVAARKLKLQ